MDSSDNTRVYEPDVPDDPGVETFLWHIYRRKMFTDVEFVLETAEEPISFSAHKMVLAMWSSKFEDMFYTGEEKNLVSLKDINPEAFQVLLRFMYGCIPNLDSHKNACDLYKVAVKFAVSSLASLCHNFLLNVNVEVSNVFDIFETAKCMDNVNLMMRCMYLVRSQTDTLLKYYKLTDFTPSMVQVILSSPKLSLGSEYELILWVFEWAKNRYIEHHRYSNLREVLHDFLHYLDFLALSNTQFATICQRFTSFFTEDEALRIFMNIGIRNSRPMPNWYNAKALPRRYGGKT